MRITTTLSVLAILALFIGLSASPAYANGCDVTITAATSIQTTIDANPGDVVCLDDSGGDFEQQVVFDAADSGVTLMAKPGDSPVMDGTALVPIPALAADTHGIELLGGASDVTIRGLEIRDYAGGFADPEDDRFSHAIHARAGATSDITVHYNYLHDNKGNGVGVGGDGSFVHDNWEIEHNFTTDNVNNGINFNNAVESEIKDNFIHDNVARGIGVSADYDFAVGGVTVGYCDKKE
ncbi:MAG: right-handed parallel beta-helix repeat-containing protein [Dehalococcoidia bacterium]